MGRRVWREQFESCSIVWEHRSSENLQKAFIRNKNVNVLCHSMKPPCDGLSLGYSSGVERFPNMHNAQFPELQKQTTKTGSKLLHRRRAHVTESFPPSTSCLLYLCHSLAETVPAATAQTKRRDSVVHGSSSRGGVLWNCEEILQAHKMPTQEGTLGLLH